MNPAIDFEGINGAALCSARSLLPDLVSGGKFRGLEYIVRNPRRDDRHPGSFSINYRTGVWRDFATDDSGADFISLVAYLRGTSQGDAARELADKLGVPVLKSNGVASSKPNGKSNDHNGTAQSIVTPQAAPQVYPWGDGGPPVQREEIRRHAYRNDDGVSIRFKIKFGDGKYVNWYRVPGGWQAKKPDNFTAVPYITRALNPFDPELKDDHIFWPEGEKDVDTLSKLNLPAFTFGGVGDGLPDGIDKFLSRRHLVILADNDERGRKHAEQKAARAYEVGAVSIKILHFPELPPKKDVSDFFANGGTVEQLTARIDAAPAWVSTELRSTSATPHEVTLAGSELAWSDPDWSLLDDRRGKLPEFPVQVLPVAWAKWAMLAAHGAGVMPDHVIVPLVGIVSSLIGGARRVQATRSWQEPMTVWSAIVGFSGTGKTPGIDVTKRHLAYIE